MIYFPNAVFIFDLSICSSSKILLLPLLHHLFPIILIESLLFNFNISGFSAKFSIIYYLKIYKYPSFSYFIFFFSSKHFFWTIFFPSPRKKNTRTFLRLLIVHLFLLIICETLGGENCARWILDRSFDDWDPGRSRDLVNRLQIAIELIIDRVINSSIPT